MAHFRHFCQRQPATCAECGSLGFATLAGYFNACSCCAIGLRHFCAFTYSIVRKKSSRKIPENSGKIPKMGVRRARSARRTPIFGIFPDFLEFSGIFFPYNTVKDRTGLPRARLPRFFRFWWPVGHQNLKNRGKRALVKASDLPLQDSGFR